LHSHSYTGNPLACRAALATLQIFDEDDVLNQNRQRASQLGQALAPLAAHPQVRHFRQRGMILAFDAQVDNPTQAASFARRMFAAGLEQEVLLRPIGRTVYLMPPYVLDEEEIALLAQRTQSVFEQEVSR
ncbi:MAG: aminotransferase class III-fold pyridoxal phosphate-dependent enzyme, partial [Lacisediminimonas sp.]|nr:aminotransferase class III-fold pyridoxal phosphate-dependent enzyme [Lacisediminimonas sp.]